MPAAEDRGDRTDLEVDTPRRHEGSVRVPKPKEAQIHTSAGAGLITSPPAAVGSNLLAGRPPTHAGTLRG
jgi:hypothetical protein